MQIVLASSWGLSIHSAEYYGWHWCLHIGRWLVFFAPTTEEG